MISEIIICNDEDVVLNELDSKNCIIKFFQGDEFLLDDARLIMQNAYLKEEKEKIFVLSYKNYSQIAQNYMLKLLEEPPFNVFFKIIVSSKNILLPTILSRLIVRKIKSVQEEFDLKLNLKQFRLEDIIKYEVDKADICLFISALLKACYKEKIRLSFQLLESFSECYELARLNTNAKVITTRLLLGVLRERS